MIDTLCDEIAAEVRKNQEEFMDRHMRKLLPPVIYTWAREKTHSKEVLGFLERHKIFQAVTPDGVDLMMGDKVVAQWRMRLKPLDEQRP